ncbi:YobA family protein [Sporosarcina sp. ACRSM]|uniref:YobA family protein n=1 Tax=Sporosarcina sp. ACRSM TaxID=2918216 RepID=UPI001EF61BF4|nr:YobA family protein [Sporosarcina sp. ACRSM]MCG7337061.1 YobA family protein [Sporosarcina sp. ACRSM]
MTEVKKSLDALSGITPEDIEEVKQRVLSGKLRKKRRNPFPLTVTALVTAAVLFFTFHLLQDGLSTEGKEDYEVNDLIYDFMLRTESDGNVDRATSETKQAVLQSLLQIDALMEYAESLGYKEDTKTIEKIVAEQREAFYAELDKEKEEKKNLILQTQEKNFGISYDDYFNVILKWTSQSEEAREWLIRHPQENSKTRGEVIGLFQEKYERAIADFMKQKTIPPFDLSVKYEELTGTVAAIEDDRILVTHGFKEDVTSKVDELIEHGAASYFIINSSLGELTLGMKIRVIYDSLAVPVLPREEMPVYQYVAEWEKID